MNDALNNWALLVSVGVDLEWQFLVYTISLELVSAFPSNLQEYFVGQALELIRALGMLASIWEAAQDVYFGGWGVGDFFFVFFSMSQLQQVLTRYIFMSDKF